MNLEIVNVSKKFPGTLALDNVSFSVCGGEVHALVGENGAGKSTAVKVIGGALTPDDGYISIDGMQQKFLSPRSAWHAGIHVIHQELLMFPQLTVAENIFLGTEAQWKLARRKRWEADAVDALDSLGHPVDPRKLVGELSVADRQMVEIARALVRDARILVLDEPSAVIAGEEVLVLMDRIRELRDSDVAIIYISHRLEEIFAISDRVTVLKDGKHVATQATDELDHESLTVMMVGRSVKDIFPPKRKPVKHGRKALEVHDLFSPPRVMSGNLELNEGEILGLGGLAGSGRSEFAEAIFGARQIKTGTVELFGEEVTGNSPKEMISRGMGFLTEDRKTTGLMMFLDIASNISAPILERFNNRGFLDRKNEISVTEKEIDRYSIATSAPEAPVANLSGGNQQKTLFSRWSLVSRFVLILDEPTRGVDIGAKSEIYRIIHSLAETGVSILLISSELTELVELSDRVVVMREGRMTGILEQEQISEESIMRLAVGVC